MINTTANKNLFRSKRAMPLTIRPCNHPYTSQSIPIFVENQSRAGDLSEPDPWWTGFQRIEPKPGNSHYFQEIQMRADLSHFFPGISTNNRQKPSCARTMRRPCTELKPGNHRFSSKLSKSTKILPRMRVALTDRPGIAKNL